MPDIGSYVIYGANGICTVKDKRKEKLCGTKNEYYVLSPLGSNNSTIYVPADNSELVARMKSILSRSEIISLIADMGDDEIFWQSDNKLRNEEFGRIIDKGDRKELLKLIKCIYLKKKELNANNKKLWAADEATLKRAEAMINAEFSLVLEIKPEEVPSFIENIIGK
ncbi:MAG: CarD family transcriptional regulator [Clostridia bacterium]|nr:CarD family transcriptional regulator [Clostridia bacterium]